MLLIHTPNPLVTRREISVQTPYGGLQSLSFQHLPAGTFMMGYDPERDGKDDWFVPDTKPLHRVTLSAFAMATYPVTQQLWEAVMGENPAWFKGSSRPVETVSWWDAVHFCNALSRLYGAQACYEMDKTNEKVRFCAESKGFRLPTEAEWEYAARAGKNHLYAGSHDLSTVAWYRENSFSQTQPVGLKQPNAFGLYDMSGNVWEWCQDWYGAYPSEDQVNPQGPVEGSYRVNRGCSWSSNPPYTRVAYRYSATPTYRNFYLGFRVALSF